MIVEHALWLGGTIAGVLLLASTIGCILKARLAPARPHAFIDNLNVRIRSWWVIAAVLGGALWAGTLVTFALFTVISLIALREYLATPALPPKSSARLWIPGLSICVVCIAFIPALLTLEIPGYAGHNVFLLLYFVIVAQASDVLQYLWGKWLGRHPIAPVISPAKTVEGFIGGITCATLLGASLWWITPFTVAQAAAIALLVALLGFAGGLFMSAEKRRRGIKDWGNLIRGHGGMLDRIDSLWLPAPLFYYFVWHGWARP